MRGTKAPDQLNEIAAGKADPNTTIPFPPAVANYLRENYGLEDVEDLLMSKEELTRLAKAVSKLELGVHATFIKTCSNNCEYLKNCPLAILRRHPVGGDCLLELDLYKKKYESYKSATIERLKNFEGSKDIEEDEITRLLICELVECDVIEFRCNQILAAEGITDEIPTLATRETVEWRTEEHAAMRMKRETKRRRDVVMKQLIATPEMAQRLKNPTKNSSPMDRANDAREKARNLMKNATIEVEAVVVGEKK